MVREIAQIDHSRMSRRTLGARRRAAIQAVFLVVALVGTAATAAAPTAAVTARTEPLLRDARRIDMPECDGSLFDTRSGDLARDVSAFLDR